MAASEITAMPRASCSGLALLGSATWPVGVMVVVICGVTWSGNVLSGMVASTGVIGSAGGV